MSPSTSDVAAFVDWLDAQPHKHKVIIAGNHDVTLDLAVYDRWRAGRQKKKQVAPGTGKAHPLSYTTTTATTTTTRAAEVCVCLHRTFLVRVFSDLLNK